MKRSLRIAGVVVLPNTRLRVEALEARDLLVSSVTAPLPGDMLALMGDAQANRLGERTGNVTLKGKGMTIVSGTSFACVNDIVLNLGNGNDRVTVRGRILAGNLTIDLGNGKDRA